MEYTLKITDTGRKDQKYLYEVVDKTGKVVSDRRSNRTYVAATIDGGYYFGRKDLVGKGDHGRNMKYRDAHKMEQTPVAYLEEPNKAN